MSRMDSYNTKPFGITTRFVIGTVATILVPPFVMLAVAPMLLVLAPVALIAIPFMLSAFAGEAREVVAVPRRLHALRPVIN
jgi:hypothetical protein